MLKTGFSFSFLNITFLFYLHVLNYLTCETYFITWWKSLEVIEKCPSSNMKLIPLNNFNNKLLVRNWLLELLIIKVYWIFQLLEGSVCLISNYRCLRILSEKYNIRCLKMILHHHYYIVIHNYGFQVLVLKSLLNDFD